MKATIEKWKLYGKDLEYPVLSIEASKEELNATDALYKLDQICRGLGGICLNKSLATVSNKDTKAQRTIFDIDLGTLLTLCAAIQAETAKRTFATAWLRNLADSYKGRVSDKVPDELRCRCGLTFKREKQAKQHRKRCSVIVEAMPLLRRVVKALKDLSGKKESNGNSKSKASKLQKAKSRKVRPQIPDRQKNKASKKRQVHRRRQTRRT